MKNKLKKYLVLIFSNMIKCFGRFKFVALIYEQIISYLINTNSSIVHNKAEFKFATPNSLIKWRVYSFSTKEPETLEWIDSIPKGAVLWDIGANIGIYSIYAAKMRDCSVYAFEPSVFNLEFLARNIYINNLTNNINIVPLPLSNQITVSELKMTSMEWGGALSTFGENFGWDGELIKESFKYKLIGVDMDSAISKLEIPVPQYIKMDVDGLEHFILVGGNNVLKSIKSILIEVNDDFAEQAFQCEKLLLEAGLILKEKRHADEIDGSNSGFQNTFNQIWIRP
jgi:FkbM family methyltransferase